MTGDEIVALCRQHTLFEWSAQANVDPIPVARAKGIYFWTPEGKRFTDFNSQLMCVNIGHGDERVIRAVQDQVATLAYANPFMATEVRGRLSGPFKECVAAAEFNDLLARHLFKCGCHRLRWYRIPRRYSITPCTTTRVCPDD